MTSTRYLLFVLCAASLAASPAAAQDDDDATQEDPEPEVSSEPPSVYDRVLSLEVTGGVDTPFGVAGAAVEILPIRYLAIYAGGGVSRSGARFAAGLRGQYPIGNTAIGLMMGVGGGPLDWDSLGADQEGHVRRYWDFGLFFHSGLTLEYRWDAGFYGRLGFGVDAYMTPAEPTECTIDGRSDCGVFAEGLSKPVRGWAGLTLGYALDL